MLQERIDKAASRGTTATAPTPAPSTAEKTVASDGGPSTAAPSDESTPEPSSPPPPAPAESPAEPKIPPPRSSYEDLTPYELREERKRLLQEKLGKEAEKGSLVAPA